MPEKNKDDPNGPVAVATGSTNNPIQDGSTRGFITGVLVFAVGYGESRADIFTDTELAVALGLITAGVFQAAGFWDKYAKPRLAK